MSFMLGIRLIRVSYDRLLQLVAVSIWNVIGVNLIPVVDIGRVTKYFYLAGCVWTCVSAVFLGGSTFLFSSHQCSIPQGGGHLWCSGGVRWVVLRRCVCWGAPFSRHTLEEWSLLPHFVHVFPFAGHVFQGWGLRWLPHQWQVPGSLFSFILARLLLLSFCGIHDEFVGLFS